MVSKLNYAGVEDTDTIHHKQLRQKLLNILRMKGITNVDVLQAMSRVPRHLFVDAHYSAAEAYEDHALQIGFEQTISQPYTVAYQSALLDIKDHDKVLEIGTGSGYQSAILFEMNADVYTVERKRALFETAHDRLIHLGYAQIKTFFGDGNLGRAEFAPFDKILVTAAAPGLPTHLLPQLKTGGMLVAPVDGSFQKMVRLTKKENSEMELESFDHFFFVPLLNGTD